MKANPLHWGAGTPQRALDSPLEGLWKESGCLFPSEPRPGSQTRTPSGLALCPAVHAHLSGELQIRPPPPPHSAQPTAEPPGPGRVVNAERNLAGPLSRSFSRAFRRRPCLQHQLTLLPTPAVAACGCHDRRPQRGDFRQQRPQRGDFRQQSFILSPSWRPDV